MTGLDKMINQILEEAKNSANGILEEAREKTEVIMKEAREEAQILGEEISEQSKADIANYKERMLSSADLTRRTSILKAKQEIISDIIEKAYQTFGTKSGDEYFSVVKDMLRKFVLPQDGVIYFSQKDLDRMSAEFCGEVVQIAQEAGGSLKISETAREIDGGFVLSYGGIEENCSIKALFDAKKDELQDSVQKLLFS